MFCHDQNVRYIISCSIVPINSLVHVIQDPFVFPMQNIFSRAVLLLCSSIYAMVYCTEHKPTNVK